MITVLLLLAVAAWLARPFWSARQEQHHEEAGHAERIATRQSVLERNPDSASAHELLGDALRAAGRTDEAIACYDAALERGSGGEGLENKLRFARMDAETPRPDLRQQVCRRCGNLSDAGQRACATCAAPLLADRFRDTLGVPGMRRELVEFAAMFAVVLLALALASWMPGEIKGVLLLSAAVTLAFFFLRGLNGDRNV